VIQYPAGQKPAARLVGAVLPGATLQQVNGLPRLRILLGTTGHAVTRGSPGPARRPKASQPSASQPGGSQKTAAQDACRRG
jgi:hypothetical protein